ncbi:26S proteasome non-ATPase regulatory subunit 14 [Conglomerata obtusa]
MNLSSSFDVRIPLPDTSESIHISSLALIKMLIHGRAGIPMEVMGLLLGTYVDEYTIQVVDVYAMPQTGTGVTVEAVDPVYQAQMTEALAIVNRNEHVIGWYHSHPGFGCWLSNVDMNTQQSFERLSKRAVGVVIDPIQSVKGKVVIDAFRLINNNMHMLGMESRQVTSNIGYLTKPTLVSLMHGLNRHYYSFRIMYKKSEIEQRMLLNMGRKTWAENLSVKKKEIDCDINGISKNYLKAVEAEEKLGGNDLELYKLGKIDYKRKLMEKSEALCKEKARRNLLLAIHSFIFSK